MTDETKVDPANALGLERSFAGTLSRELAKHGPAHAMNREMLAVLVRLYISDKSDWLRCREVLRPLKVMAEVQREVKRLAKAQCQEDAAVPPASEICPALEDIRSDAPVPGLELPPSYRVDDSGRLLLSKTKIVEQMPILTEEVVAPCLLVITRRMFDLDSDDVSFEISWPEGHRWHHRKVSRGSALVARKLGDLSSIGLPVTSTTAAKTVDYLGAFESHNGSSIPRVGMSRRLGWHGPIEAPSDGGFLLGSLTIGGEDDIMPDGPAEDVARQVVHNGSLTGWQDAMRPMVSIPNVKLALAAALAAPLVAIVQRGSCIVEWAASTSRGKTTLLRIAESCWGDPEQPLRTWDTTQVGLERLAASRCDLPLIIDDTATAPSYAGKSTVQSSAYLLLSGRSKTRGTLGGSVEKGVTWRTVVLTTGERPISQMGNAEGATARVLSITEEPLGEVSKRMGEKIERTLKTLRHQYGCAGPAFVQWLDDNRDTWPKIREVYETSREMITKLAPSGVGARAGHAVGLLAASLWVGKQSGVLPWYHDHLLGDNEIVRILGASLEAALLDSDRTNELYDVLHSTWYQHRHRFHGHSTTSNPPAQGWLGRHIPDSGVVDWYAEPFKRACKEVGLAIKQASASLAARGALIQGQKNPSRVVRVDGGSVRVYSMIVSNEKETDDGGNSEAE